MRCRSFLPLSAILLLACASEARAVEVWKLQVERLQLVSGALLDAPPALEPSFQKRVVGARAVVSFLPEVNPKVGTKTEKVPSPPVHSIPSVFYYQDFLDSGGATLGARAWVGYLPAFAAKLAGVDGADVSQLGFGAALHSDLMKFSALGGMSLSTALAYQFANGKLSGQVASKAGGDTFDVKTQLAMASLGAKFNSIQAFAGAQIIYRKSASAFYIAQEENNVELEDAGLGYQLVASKLFPYGIQVGLTELIVPERLYMPRLLLSYQYAF